MKSIYALALSVAVTLSAAPLVVSAAGDHAGGHSGHTMSSPTGATAASETKSAANASSGSTAAMTEGEIRKVDKDAGKVTIRHGELKNLDMPAMTMVFQVKDKSMLEAVKTGDKVSFIADKVDGKFTVMQMETKK